MFASTTGGLRHSASTTNIASFSSFIFPRMYLPLRQPLQCQCPPTSSLLLHLHDLGG